MLSLPPRSSQKTQPLDRIFLKQFKNFYDEGADNWTACHPGPTLQLRDAVAEICQNEEPQEGAVTEKTKNGPSSLSGTTSR
ncbi:hypothetical protein ILUMI_25585 [Ignelater luminosus]|uniref:Uncharacterized protein n=1 Tax=Ignelater luminosus TaxID=2038154 RepID=A0A8K0FZS9_IGNLU|nr:hypothetical protein ILUMI_25585 [Ignelater luminosus]